MKRFISALLAMAMLIAFVPVVSAEGDAADPIVYTYNFNNVALGKDVVSGQKYSQLVKGDTATKSGNVWKSLYVVSNNERIFDTGIAGNTGGSGGTVPHAGTGWGFELTVPQKGTYVPTVVYDMAPRGTIITTLVFSKTRLQKEGWAFSSKGVPVILETFGVTQDYKFDTYDENSSGLKIDKASKPVVLPRTDLDEGANYMLFSPTEYNSIIADNLANIADYNVQFEIRTLTLTKVPAAKVEITGAPAPLAIGAEATISAKVYDSENAEISDTVTYSSSAPSVASVDAATGVVTANASGEATITATTSNGKTDTVKVAVGKTTKYYFTKTAFKEDFASTITGLSEDGKADGTNYEYIADGAAKWDCLNGYGAQSLKIFNKNNVFRVARGATIVPNVNGLTFRINVPEAGKYKLNFNYFKNSNGLIAGVWFADEKMIAEKNITMAGDGSSTGCRLVMRNYEPDIEVDTYEPSILADESETSKGLTPASSDKTYELIPGEYYVVIGVTGKNEKFDNSKTGDAAGNDGTSGAFSYMLYEGIDLVKVGNYVAPEVPEVSDKVSFYVGETVKGAVTGSHEAAYKYELSVGEEVSLTAAEKIGDYTFVGWKNSAGVLVSTNASETFTIYTNTFLTAVYDKKADENETSATVEFWNRSGNLIKSVTVEPGTEFGAVSKPKAELNGFGDASGWSISDETKIYGTVRAVALYDYEDTGASTKAVAVNGVAVENPTYNQKITPTLSGATYWTRNAKTVAFGESFTHYIFNSANGSAIVGHKGAVTVRPVIALDTNSDDYSMIEYDAAGKTIVEAGIIYGPNKDITVGSCVTKATVKNIKSHGQFVACPNPDSSLDQSVARGYIIYRDGSSFRVVYSD